MRVILLLVGRLNKSDDECDRYNVSSDWLYHRLTERNLVLVLPKREVKRNTREIRAEKFVGRLVYHVRRKNWICSTPYSACFVTFFIMHLSGLHSP